ncbi:hypothetical protein HanIR_Chr05g0238441 [Helianthus annuus]|nr:hypothetical protein HanIR_Chr05g0238441 [Helianthus annuus]
MGIFLFVCRFGSGIGFGDIPIYLTRLPDNVYPKFIFVFLICIYDRYIYFLFIKASESSLQRPKL